MKNIADLAATAGLFLFFFDILRSCIEFRKYGKIWLNTHLIHISKKWENGGVEVMSSLFENNERKYYSLCEDWTFHYVFTKETEESRNALMGLVNVILDRRKDPITKIEILNPIHYGDRNTEKKSILDIKAETSSGELINIEMQNGNQTYFGNRSLKYGMRLVNSSLEKGETYGRMKKSIVISLTTGVLFPGLSDLHNVFRILNVKNHGEEETVLMTDRLEFHFLELGKLDGKKPVAEMTTVEKVAAYLKYAGDENHEAYTQDLLREGGEEIAMMEYVFKKLTADDIAREIRFSEEMAEHDRATIEWERQMKEEARRKEEEARRKELEERAKEAEVRALEKGLISGQERINKLNCLLIEEGRTDDLIKAAADSEFQSQLLKDFGL